MKFIVRCRQILGGRRNRAWSAAMAIAFAAAASLGVWAAYQAAAPPRPQLAAMLPQGALLSIEARDFSALLKQWNDSPEKSAWLKSANYSVFANSRLFGRLGSAQEEFAAAAGLPPDLAFLKEVAGTESIFAWYDIGNLEFLYITRMPSVAAQQTRLLGMRGKFATRQAGGQTFYVRTLADPEKQGQPRTVAFATTGDWLLLATREDLMAGALTLMAAPADDAHSLAAEPWFADAQSAAGKEPGQLRMTLNLEKIVPTPYFRSYWIQRNISEMKQFRSAVADLHMESGSFREERVLLSKSPHEADSGETADLAPVLRLLPQHAGVYRALALPSSEAAVASIDEKLLRRGTGASSENSSAPNADLAVQPVGGAEALETRLETRLDTRLDTRIDTRIDTMPLSHPVAGSELTALRQVLDGSGLEAMLTVSRTGPAVDGVWVPFQSAIVLAASRDWDAAALQAALQQTLGRGLSASNLGLTWKPVRGSAGDHFEISSVRPLELAVRGRLCILADSPTLIEEMLARDSSAKSGTASRFAVVAGFEPARERVSFARWSALVDRHLSGGPSADVGAGADAGANGSSGNGSGAEPAFFSQNMRSLGEVFAALDRERFVERRDGMLIRQTVTYTWRK